MTPIEYRAPRTWLPIGVLLVAAGAWGLVSGAASALFTVAAVLLGAAMLFVRARAWLRIDDDGIAMRPNGVKTFEVPWDEVIGMQGRRLRFVVDDDPGEAMVTVPPLAGDPIHRVRAELQHRQIWEQPASSGFKWPRRGE